MSSTHLLHAAEVFPRSRNRTHPPLPRDSRDLMDALVTRRLLMRLLTLGMLYLLLSTTGSERYLLTSDPTRGVSAEIAVWRLWI